MSCPRRTCGVRKYTYTYTTYSTNANSANYTNFAADLKAVLPDSFNEDFLRAHNVFRKRHGVEPLKLSQASCNSAEEWAKHLARQDALQYRSCGQNIHCGTSTKPETVLDAWYNTGSNYVYGREPGNTSAGHFSQMLWKDTREVGVGVAQSPAGRIYVVADYNPWGNYISQHAKNVFPPKKDVPEPITTEKGVKKDESDDGDSSSESEDEVAKARPVQVKAQPPGPASNEYQGSKFEKDSLIAHNEYRKRHHAAPLKLSKKLCDFAQQWANNLASQDRMYHRSNNSYGENCFMSSGSDVSGKAPVDAWYSEVKYYRFGSGGFAMNTGHFTQVVWKNSREMGVGVAKSRRGSTYVVANYDPPGNYAGQFGSNVLPA